MLEVVVSAARIQERVQALGAAIARDHAAGVHLVCVLKGAMVFTADLMRAIPVALTLDCVHVASYGDGRETSGAPRLERDLGDPVEGRAVVVVEDIVDTGLTLAFLLDHLRARRPATLRVAALLSKPDRRRVEVAIDYLGFEVPDRFLVGYGLDGAGRHRNLPHVAALPDGFSAP